MSKIEFTYNEKPYVLEYDRASVVQMEKTLGVSLNAIRESQLSVFPDLFRGAFIKNHPALPAETIDEIYDCIPDKGEMFGNLAGMYAEAVNTLLAEPSKGKAIAWKMV